MYILTNTDTQDTETFETLTETTNYIDDMTGPIWTDFDLIDSELKQKGQIILKEGWKIEVNHDL